MLFSFSEPLYSVKSIKQGLISSEHTDLLIHLTKCLPFEYTMWYHRIIFGYFKNPQISSQESDKVSLLYTSHPTSCHLFEPDIKLTIQGLSKEYLPHCPIPRELDHIH